MSLDDLILVRDALTGGHTGDLSAEGQRKYLAALGIIERAMNSTAASGASSRDLNTAIAPKGGA